MNVNALLSLPPPLLQDIWFHAMTLPVGYSGWVFQRYFERKTVIVLELPLTFFSRSFKQISYLSPIYFGFGSVMINEFCRDLSLAWWVGFVWFQIWFLFDYEVISPRWFSTDFSSLPSNIFNRAVSVSQSSPCFLFSEPFSLLTSTFAALPFPFAPQVGSYITPRNVDGTLTQYPANVGPNQVCTLRGAESGAQFVDGMVGFSDLESRNLSLPSWCLYLDRNWLPVSHLVLSISGVP